jgi:hypothetical protein
VRWTTGNMYLHATLEALVESSFKAASKAAEQASYHDPWGSLRICRRFNCVQ